MVELVIRLVFSLAVVLGMLLLLTKFSAKRFRGGTDALVRIVHRQPLSRTSAVAVVTVGSRVLVIGTTEHQVQLLTELDPEELDLPSELLEASELSELSETGDRADAPELGGLTAVPALADVPERLEVPEHSGFSTLDELLTPYDGQAGAPDEPADRTYSPRHAASGVAAPALTAAPPAAARTRPRSFSHATAASRAAEGALAGSLLSAQTWKQALAAATGRARDAS